MVWARAALQDLCTLVTDGTHDSPKLQKVGVPFIKGKHISGGSVDFENCDYITYEDHLKVIARSKPERGDILFSNIGSVGAVAFINTDIEFSIKNVALLKPDPSKIHSRYLYYFVLSSRFQDSILNKRSGVAQPFIGLSTLREHVIEYHADLPTQRRIADILSAYDDLIENNARRIAVLEEMAQRLYREWFVHFRLPGHEDVELVEDDATGMVHPEGWEVVRLGDIADVHRGRSYRSSDLVEENSLPFLNLKSVDREGGYRHDGLKRYAGNYKETQTAEPGDIIVAVTDMTQERRIVARAARVPSMGDAKYVFSMDLVKVSPRDGLDKSYLYSMLRFSNFPDGVKQYANGANVLHLRPHHIEDFLLALPPIGLRQRYSEIAMSVFQQQDILHQKNEVLRQTRDLLLPRLVSGEVAVKEWEAEIA